jgi:hypothetical protein
MERLAAVERAIGPFNSEFVAGTNSRGHTLFNPSDLKVLLSNTSSHENDLVTMRLSGVEPLRVRRSSLFRQTNRLTDVTVLQSLVQDPVLLDFLEKGLCLDHNRRWSAESLLKHRFIVECDGPSMLS